MVSAGVLALQGDVAPHLAAFRALGVDAAEVRSRADLEGVSHLVLPGGESTTVAHLLELTGLGDELVRRTRAGELALFGTCAGAILLGREAEERPARLALLDVDVERNAYGRQVDGFTANVTLPEEVAGDAAREVPGVFIRAPRLHAPGPDVRVLSERHGEPVLVRSDGILAATFHPELTDDPVLHRYFLRTFAPTPR